MTNNFQGPDRRGNRDAAYNGPERRSVITFTREDSDRLVRLEQQNLTIMTQLTETHKAFSAQAARLSKLERVQNWMMGVGAAVTFIISSAILFFKH